MSQTKVDILLASASPQRFTLLEQAHYSFTARGFDFIEDHTGASKAEDLVKLISQSKLQQARDLLPEWQKEAQVLVCADTMVFIDNTALGKPKDKDDARRMIRSLSGKRHRVISGIAVQKENQSYYATSLSEVEVASLDEAEIEWYLSTDEWRGAAGSYRIQGAGASLVSNITGSYTGIVGLPLDLFYVMMRRIGITPKKRLP